MNSQKSLGLIPWSSGRINGAKEGTAQPAGPKFGQIGFLDTLEAAKSSDHFASELPKSKGDGLVVGWPRASGLTLVFSPARQVAINSDGTANVVTGSTDIGGTRASCAMIAA